MRHVTPQTAYSTTLSAPHTPNRGSPLRQRGEDGGSQRWGEFPGSHIWLPAPPRFPAKTATFSHAGTTLSHLTC